MIHLTRILDSSQYDYKLLEHHHSIFRSTHLDVHIFFSSNSNARFDFVDISLENFINTSLEAINRLD